MSKKEENETKENAQENTKAKQKRLSQTSCPAFTIDEALIIPKALKDNFAGKPTTPVLLAGACKISPSSSKWRTLTGSAGAYGLTSGGYNSKQISLTDLGSRIVSPILEGDDLVALKEAVMKPQILSDFYQQFDNNKLPRYDIACNILESKGVPKDKLSTTWEILRSNAKKIKILQPISGNEYITLNNNTTDNTSKEDINNPEFEQVVSEENNIPINVLEKMNIEIPSATTIYEPKIESKPKIFISHGKNSSVIVNQLKQLIEYGQMEPIVSIEREATAIPVPDKVFDDMRNCNAGIINIDLEEVPVDESDIKYKRINENVLIEIGAAIALYKKRVILLCKKNTPLPSNLQGLYRCELDENQLDYNSTMKLLKTIQELRELM